MNVKKVTKSALLIVKMSYSLHVVASQLLFLYLIDYEIIEVNGFAIKRRKSDKVVGGGTQPPPVVCDTPKDASVRPAPVQRTPNVEEYEISAELYSRLTKALHDFPESGPASSRLLAVCSSICAAEIDTVKKTGNEEVEKALEKVFGDFMEGMASAIDNGTIQMAPSLGDGFSHDLKIDIESRKLGLQRRLEILEKEEREWSELLQKLDSIDLDANLPDTENAGMGSAAPRTDLADEEIKGLQELKASMQQQVSMQVEGVSMIVGNIEDLIEKANEKAKDAQKKLHTDRAKAHPHINSPARLIKAIIRPE